MQSTQIIPKSKYYEVRILVYKTERQNKALSLQDIYKELQGFCMGLTLDAQEAGPILFMNLICISSLTVKINHMWRPEHRSYTACLIHFAIFSHSFQTKVKCKNCNVLVVQGSCAVWCSRVVYDQVKIQGRNVRVMHREHTCAHLHHTLLVVLCF